MLDNRRPLCYNKNIEREVIKMEKNLQKKSMTKKQWKEEQKKNRLLIPMNTGTRTMKTAKNGAGNRALAKPPRSVRI